MSARTTFYKLIKKHGRVVIPIIQRDYAQGRADQHIVRDDFLKAMSEALCQPEGAHGLPLDLDFVYGSIVNDSFQPLDGQQRLTTLFLLHWYLAWKDGRTQDFLAHFVDEKGRSRFGYEVRPDSRDFIDALASYVPGIAVVDCQDLDSLLTDQPWFFRRYKYDPTICSALSMLKRMHEIFRKTSDLYLYARLIDKRAPAITFQLLVLEEFGLSDDLYIKMNARGKPLTSFETFKARFERHLKKQQFKGAQWEALCCDEPSISDFFALRIDTRWSDFFWPFRDERTATFDDAVMNLVRAVIMVTRPSGTDTDTSKKTEEDLDALRSPTRASNFVWFYGESWLDEEMVFAMITLLERWSADPDKFRGYLPPDTRYFDEKAFFNEIITRPTSLSFRQLAQLAGYVQYLVHAHGEEIDPSTFNDWMRVVFNLAANTDYNESGDLRRSLAGLRRLVPHMNDITRHLAGPECDVPGFSRDQVKEERIKAHLLEFGEDWPERIHRAEQHSYFQGQIGFVLHFCGINLDDLEAEFVRLDVATVRPLGAIFEHYFTCAAQMFDDIENEPRGAGRLWERALLAIGDFLIDGSLNRSLLKQTRRAADWWSWKRLLRDAATDKNKGRYLKELWDCLKERDSFVSDLTKIIETKTDIEAWREIIISTPSVYGYGDYAMLRFSTEERVYLLKKSQMNGRHAELFTYCLHEYLRTRKGPFSLTLDYKESTSTVEPGLDFSTRFDKDDIRFNLRSGSTAIMYELCLETPGEPECKLRSVLENEGFEENSGLWKKQIKRAEMKTEVLALDHALAQNM